MKTIYNVAVLMDSQETCNRMKQLCIDNGLPIWKRPFAFDYSINCGTEFYCSDDVFCVLYDSGKNLVTEAEFIELLKQEKG
jgi:hypothetical protein